MIEYFTDEELSCKCCGKLVFSDRTRQRLNVARYHAGVPFVITSGYRCPEYNKKIGASFTSSHVKGCAADIKANWEVNRFKIISGLLLAGFTRIGIGKDFIHADDDPVKQKELIWVYL